MSAIAERPQPTIGAAIARRALDLALDASVTLEEGAAHLCRLSKERHAPLEEALDELRRSPDGSPEEEHARLLLFHALAWLVATRRVAG